MAGSQSDEVRAARIRDFRVIRDEIIMDGVARDGVDHEMLSPRGDDIPDHATKIINPDGSHRIRMDIFQISADRIGSIPDEQGYATEIFLNPPDTDKESALICCVCLNVKRDAVYICPQCDEDCCMSCTTKLMKKTSHCPTCRAPYQSPRNSKSLNNIIIKKL